MEFGLHPWDMENLTPGELDAYVTQLKILHPKARRGNS